MGIVTDPRALLLEIVAEWLAALKESKHKEIR